MNAAIAKTLFQITQKQSMEEVSAAELTQLANHYPYFAPLQVLLAAKLKTENSYEAASQLQKAALFGNNPFWLEHGLFNGEAKGITIIHADKTESVAKVDTQYQQAAAVEAAPEPVVIAAPVPVAVTEKPVVPFPSSIEIPTVENIKGIMEGIDKKEETAEQVIMPPAEQPIVTVTPETPAQQGFSSVVSNNISSLGSMPSYASFFQNKVEDSPEEPEATEEEENSNRPDDIADNYSENRLRNYLLCYHHQWPTLKSR